MQYAASVSSALLLSSRCADTTVPAMMHRDIARPYPACITPEPVCRACSPPHLDTLGLRFPARLQLLAEIKIHRSLSHRYVVGFESFFEDRHNVYIMLELCGNQVRACQADSRPQGVRCCEPVSTV